MYDFKDNYQDALIINRLNGSRLSVRDGSVREGAQVIEVRSSGYDKEKYDYPQRWNIKKVGEEGGHNIVHIEISDGKGNTFRLDAGTDKPSHIDENDKLFIKKPDDHSDRQKWKLWVDFSAVSILHQLAPKVDPTRAITLQNNFGNPWDEVVLSRSLSSADRLWYFNDHKETH
jgi:hypothetical protein